MRTVVVCGLGAVALVSIGLGVTFMVAAAASAPNIAPHAAIVLRPRHRPRRRPAPRWRPPGARKCRRRRPAWPAPHHRRWGPKVAEAAMPDRGRARRHPRRRDRHDRRTRLRLPALQGLRLPQPKEVVLTFDDGPLPNRTTAMLAALDAQCTKATFFSVGKVAAGTPRSCARRGGRPHHRCAHRSHVDLMKKIDEAKDEIEKGSARSARRPAAPSAPFFRFPFLRHPPEMLKYLGEPQHRRVLDRHRQLRLQGPNPTSSSSR